MEDKIPGITPGFGRADSIDGEVWPYIFPIAASDWSRRTTRAAAGSASIRSRATEWLPASDWIRGDHDEVIALVKKATRSSGTLKLDHVEVV